MRTAWVLLAGSLALPGEVEDPLEKRYGIGLLLIHEYAEHNVITASLFDSTGYGLEHARWIEFDRFDHVSSDGLLPFEVDRFYDAPFFVCKELKGDWFKVRLKGDKCYWVRQEERYHSMWGEERQYLKFEFISWGRVFASCSAIDRTDELSNPIRARPSTNAPIVEYDHWCDLEAIGRRGNWLKVIPSHDEACEADTLDEDELDAMFFDHGWIQWRNDSTFLIRI